MPARPKPRRRNAPSGRMHSSISPFAADAAAVKEIARRTGLRIDSTVAALVRLFDHATPTARLAAGFPALPAGAHDVPRPSEAHEAPNPTIGAAA